MLRLTASAILLALAPWGASAMGGPDARFRDLTDDGTLQPFLDSVVEESMARVGSPGAALSLVQGDRIVLLRGYGFADNAGEVPIDPARHVFRIGSITKMLTATAILQLHDQGRIDLDEDVNTYLREFRLPDTYAEPVTTRHLLQHTAGLDNDYVGLGLRSHGDHVPLGKVFAGRVPRRIRPPGRVIVYTNRASMLLGHVVEAVSGESYEDYLSRHVFAPLDMNRSVFEPPPGLRSDFVQGTPPSPYDLLPQDFVDTNTRPSSDLASTARDMARFMIAHLNDGVVDGARILAPGTAAKMQRECFVNHPRLRGGRCLGWEWSMAGDLEVVRHGGMHRSVRSGLYLLPEARIGLFVTGRGPREFADEVFGRFVERYFPPGVRSRDAEAPGASVTRVRDVTGAYRTLGQMSLATFEKLLYLGIPDVRASASADGRLRFGEKRFLETGPLVFVAEGDPDDVLAFLDGDDGRVSLAASNDATWQKLAWYETRRVQLGAAAASLAILATGLVAWPIGSIFRRRDGAKPARCRWAALFLGWLAAFLWVLSAGGFVIVAVTQVDTFLYGLSTAAKLPFALAAAAAVDTVFFGIAMGIVWWRGEGSLAARLYGSAVALASFVLVFWARYWNVL